MERRKVALLGDTNVGKTSLLKWYISDGAIFDKPESTNAAAFELIDMNNVQLEVWDTAGQERFRNIVELYVRDVDVAFICFDSTSPNSASVLGWANYLLSISQNSVLILVATKSDLCDTQKKLDDINRYVDGFVESHKDFVNSFITSSKTGAQIKDLFQCAADVKLPEKKSRPESIRLTGDDTNLKKDSNGDSSCC